MGHSYRETRRHSTIGEPSTQDLDGWEFGLSRETTARTANTPNETIRTELATGERRDDELAGWTFGEANERHDSESADAAETGSGTSSSLETRLAPIVRVLIVLSLLLGGGYILAVTIW